MGVIWEISVWVFLLVTVILGGGAAWITGRVVARSWEPWRQLLVYALLLAAAVRFLHFSLFGGSFNPVHDFVEQGKCTLRVAPGRTCLEAHPRVVVGQREKVAECEDRREIVFNDEHTAAVGHRRIGGARHVERDKGKRGARTLLREPMTPSD